MHLRRLRLLAVCLLVASGCADNHNNVAPISATAPSSTTPTPTTTTDTIEYRVTGDVTSAIITTDDGINGRQITVTGLPFDTTVNSTRSSLFVSLDAQALTTTTGGTYTSPYLVAQIFINGTLFLQASDQSTSPHAAVSGTWRR